MATSQLRLVLTSRSVHTQLEQQAASRTLHDAICQLLATDTTIGNE